MTVMSSWVEWRQVKQYSNLNDLERPHWEKKIQAEQKEEYRCGIYTDTECYKHCLQTCVHTMGTCCCAIWWDIFFTSACWLISWLHLRDEFLFSYVPWCILFLYLLTLKGTVLIRSHVSELQRSARTEDCLCLLPAQLIALQISSSLIARLKCFEMKGHLSILLCLCVIDELVQLCELVELIYQTPFCHRRMESGWEGEGDGCRVQEREEGEVMERG